MLGEGTLKQLRVCLVVLALLASPAVYSQPVESAEEAAEERTERTERIDESTLLFDDAPAAADGQDFGTAPSLGLGDFVRMVAVLALVVAAIYGIFFVLKKVSLGSSTDSDLIRPLGSRTLPGNKSLHLVEIGQQVFLIGAADHAVNLIAEITDKESIDQLVLAAAAADSGARKKSFSELLGGVIGTGRAGATAPAGGPLQFMNQQKERLRKLR